MLKMKNLQKTYRVGPVETQALNGLNLEVGEGEFVAITGPSGSGKSTFLQIAGLLAESSGGEYWLDNEEVSHMSDRYRSQLRNQKLGFIFQSFNLIPEVPIFDNVELPLRYRRMRAKERKFLVMEALAQMGLASRASHYPSELSGGQQQRVAIARALVGRPRLLLADEPTGNLNSQMARAVMNILEDINAQGTTIVMVTHDQELAARAHRNVYIIDGQVSEIEKLPALMGEDNERLGRQTEEQIC